MKSEWNKVRWGDIAELRYGKALKDYKKNEAGYPVYGTNGRIGTTNIPLCSHSGVIIGRKGAYRGVHYSSKPFYVIDTAFFLEVLSDEKVDYKWAYYNLSTVDINSMDSGSAIPSTSREDFYSLEVNLPSIKDQRAIAATLSCLDNKIELNNKINANLEAQAQAIFKSWFVDFEPFQDGEFVDSELGSIPKGWRVGMLEEVIKIYDSKRVPLSGRKRAKLKKIYPYYGAATAMDYIDDYLFDGIYILLGEDGTVITDDGYPVLQYVWGKFWVNNHAHVLKADCGFSEESLYVFLKNIKISGIVTGAVQAKISQANLKSIKIVIPNGKDIEKFNQIINPMFNYRRKLAEQSQTLVVLRDALLPKLMNGKIEVPL